MRYDYSAVLDCGFGLTGGLDGTAVFQNCALEEVVGAAGDGGTGDAAQAPDEVLDALAALGEDAGEDEELAGEGAVDDALGLFFCALFFGFLF